jgi:hypothetical protein
MPEDQRFIVARAAVAEIVRQEETRGEGWWTETDADTVAAFTALLGGLHDATWTNEATTRWSDTASAALIDVEASGDVDQMRRELTAFEVLFGVHEAPRQRTGGIVSQDDYPPHQLVGYTKAAVAEALDLLEAADQLGKRLQDIWATEATLLAAIGERHNDDLCARWGEITGSGALSMLICTTGDRLHEACGGHASVLTGVPVGELRRRFSHLSSE